MGTFSVLSRKLCTCIQVNTPKASKYATRSSFVFNLSKQMHNFDYIIKLFMARDDLWVLRRHDVNVIASISVD
jgi:hypothetical protein